MSKLIQLTSDISYYCWHLGKQRERLSPLVAGKPEIGEGLSGNFTLGVQRSGIPLTIC